MDAKLVLLRRLRNMQRHKVIEKFLKMTVLQLVGVLLGEIDAKNDAYDFIVNKGLVAEFEEFCNRR
ncbi:hypothetical protein [Butyricimonas synergistica]|uniref:hypothetical protein n=1 Tax=Butyricimonas synergistica TaxID=544644 RepID=UPI0022E85DA3|nr:hypothetical protein [Butyricimonas synergistica]